MHITVENIRRLDVSGNLKAFVSVNIGDKLTIHSCRIIQQLNQKPWFCLPQREWTDQHRDAIQEAVLDAWEQTERV